MNPEPLYRAEGLNPAYRLRYSWSGWFAASPWMELPDAEMLASVAPLWESDGMRLLEHFWSRERLQMTFSAKPDVSPIVMAGRAKGRLQHSPQEIALGFQNNLAYALGQRRIFADGFYVGTFSEYDMGAIRRTASPL